MRLDTEWIRVEFDWNQNTGDVFAAIEERDGDRHVTRIVALGQVASTEDVAGFLLAMEVVARAHLTVAKQEALF